MLLSACRLILTLLDCGWIPVVLSDCTIEAARSLISNANNGGW